MGINRRTLLVGALMTLGAERTRALGNFSGPATVTPQVKQAHLAAAARLPAGGYGVLILAEDGTILRTLPLKGRGHDIAVDPVTRRAVAFSRRPGFFAVAFSLDENSAPHVFAPPDNRHFYGHGVFSGDGRLLYTTENDVAQNVGRIGIYETGRWSRVGEFSSFGIGPHQLILMPDGTTLAVANGGFASDAGQGRAPINLMAMEPSLAFVDTRNGDFIAKHELPNSISQLSIRHLAATANGDVWFGGQWKSDLRDAPALIGHASQDRALELCDLTTGKHDRRRARSPASGASLRGYIGSVALSNDGRYLAATATKAGQVLYVDTETRTLIHTSQLRDCSGIAATGTNHFAVTSGFGIVTNDGPRAAPRTAFSEPSIAFDNHATKLSV